MAYERITREYQKNAVNGSSPLQLVVMLYDGALKHMEAGRKAMAFGDRDKQKGSEFVLHGGLLSGGSGLGSRAYRIRAPGR